MGVRIPDEAHDTTDCLRYTLEVVETATGWLPRWELHLPEGRLVEYEELIAITQALEASILKIDEVHRALKEVKREDNE